MSDKAQQLYEEAMQANLTGNVSRAVDLFKQVVEEDPERLDAWTELAKIATDRDDRRMALTSILNFDPDNAYAKGELEALEKPKNTVDEEAEVVPGITRKQARTVGIGLALYTLLVCGATLLITSSINGSKAARAAEIAQLVVNQTETQQSIQLTSTEVVVIATQNALDANATLLAQNTATPTATNTPARVLPTEIPPSPTPTEVSLRVLELPPALPGRILAWGGEDIRSKEFLPLRDYNLSQPGTFEVVFRDLGLGRNPIRSRDGTITAFEQWRSDGTRLYMNALETVSIGGTVDALISTAFIIINLRDPSLSADNKRLAFIATDYATQIDEPYVADLSNMAAPRFYKLNQDAASYTAITISPDGMQAVAVRQEATTDLVVFDLTTLGAAPANPPQAATPGLGTPTMIAPTAPSLTIPLRPLTTDGNSLIEDSPSFSPDGTRVVFAATSSSTPDNSDLYIVTVGAAPSPAVPIMTLDGNDVSPTFSPDGNLVAFASDRQTGVYNIYIYDTTTRVTYQLTEDEAPVFPGWWSN